MQLTALTTLSDQVLAFVREGFQLPGAHIRTSLRSEPLWQRLRALGTELWLDTGDAAAIADLWTRELTSLTTNNTLLNKEVQKGSYDDFIRKAGALLDQHPGLSEEDRRLELAFMLNARHALGLVQRFDAFVSVEEHTALAHDAERALQYARRFYAICPERFIVKIPFTPAGILATRRAALERIPVNHTLGFSARQNYLIARIARPAFVNVFLGRLNSVVADNGLGSGRHVGERATMASQTVIHQLRDLQGLATRQIAASLRDGKQVLDLGGVDVMTMPPPVAAGYLKSAAAADQTVSPSDTPFDPDLNEDAKWARVDTLWDIEDEFVQCVDRLDNEDLDVFDAEDLIDYLQDEGCGDVLVRWSDADISTSRHDGKIPILAHWRSRLEDGSIGLDALMNLAGFTTFATDQEEMDRHVTAVLG
jgi:transaldolase